MTKQFSTFQTSTVLSCAQCKTEISMFTPVVTDGTSYWHAEKCAPQSEPSEVHTDESPETDDESKGD